MASSFFYVCIFSLIVSTLAGFTFKDCGTSGVATATFHNLVLVPDPIDYPGTVKITTDLETTKPFPDDVTIGVRLVKLNPDLRVPCMDNFGSCDYDACAMLTKHAQLCSLFPSGQTCKCPIPAGRYSSDQISVTLPNFGPIFGKVLQGDYKGNLTIFSKSAPNTLLGCASVTFSIKANS